MKLRTLEDTLKYYTVTELTKWNVLKILYKLGQRPGVLWLRSLKGLLGGHGHVKTISISLKRRILLKKCIGKHTLNIKSYEIKIFKKKFFPLWYLYVFKYLFNRLKPKEIIPEFNYSSRSNGTIVLQDRYT